MKLVPALLTIFLIIWTVAVYPVSKYGDKWAIYPALAVMPATVIVHIWLIIAQKPRTPYILYGVLHTALQFVLWIYCLMRIGKDSF